MKRQLIKGLAISAIFLTGFANQSCTDNDDDPIVVNKNQSIGNPNDFKGVVKSGETVTLDATKTYKLTGAVNVKSGGKLYIPAGTRIEATGGTSSFIVIEKGGQIFATGTSSQPVVFTSPAASPGSWGGVVICGDAPINKGTTATSEVGNASYGGTNPADNSGILSYVRIEYAGAVFTTQKEFNGLSLFGVGNGTSIKNISILNGSDDGIEFFGGTVNVENILSVGNEDDMFDWTEGWNGTATNLYGKRRANGVGNRGFEGDNNSNNNDADPRSNPTIKNVTLIGAQVGSESDAMKLRVGTHATIDNVYLKDWKTGLNIEHDASVSYFNGNGKITNVKFDNVATMSKAKSSAGTAVTLTPNTYTENASAVGAGNGANLPTWATGWSGL